MKTPDIQPAYEALLKAEIALGQLWVDVGMAQDPISSDTTLCYRWLAQAQDLHRSIRRYREMLPQAHPWFLYRD